MPLVRKDRVWETSTTSGTGTYTLAGAKTAKHQAFSVCGDGAQVPYMATPVDNDSAGWEVGVGTYSGGTLTRDQISESSNGGSAVSWSGEAIDVILPFRAEDYTAMVAAIENQQFHGTYVVSGSVAWDTGLIFQASAHEYFIDSLLYNAGATTVTLDTADPTNPRIDLIVATNAGTIIKVTGTPAANPAAPELAVGQVLLTFVTVGAGATTPTITETDIYLEDTEWTSSVSGGTIDAASVVDAYSGTTSIEATAAAATHYVELDKGSSQAMADIDLLEIHIKSKAVWPTNKRLRLTFRTAAGVVVGNFIDIRTSGTYGFSSSNVADWQTVAIPKVDFGIGSQTVQILRIAVVGGGATIGWFADQIRLQSGVPPFLGGGDNLGNHTATQDLDMSGHAITAAASVDVTGNITVAGTVDGRDIAADGAVLDTALQPGDIDTLAELNAIITASTLIDTTDARLSDRRRPKRTVATLTDGATVAVDVTLGDIFELLAAGDRTLSNPTGMVDGDIFILRHKASAADRTLALGTAYRFGTDITALTATTSGKIDKITFEYNATDLKWDVVAYIKGF